MCARVKYLCSEVFFSLGLLNSPGSITWNSLKFLKSQKEKKRKERKKKRKGTCNGKKKLKTDLCQWWRNLSHGHLDSTLMPWERIKEGFLWRVFCFALLCFALEQSLHVYNGTSCVNQHRSPRPNPKGGFKQGLPQCLSNSGFVLGMVAHSFNPCI